MKLKKKKKEILWLPSCLIGSSHSLRASSLIWTSEASLASATSRLRRSLARFRETRFTRPNRRACSQAIQHTALSFQFKIPLSALVTTKRDFRKREKFTKRKRALSACWIFNRDYRQPHYQLQVNVKRKQKKFKTLDENEGLREAVFLGEEPQGEPC